MYILSTLYRSLQISSGLLILLVVYRVLKKRKHNQQFIRDHGCAPAKARPTKYPFGIDMIRDNLKSLKEHTALEQYQAEFRHLGCATFWAKQLHLHILFTMDPENIKSILATDFKSYSVGEERNKALKPFLGDGIFTTDGAQWQHSRDMLRPCFARSQIGDRDLFEHHFQHLLREIPRDGSTVNLQDLFFRLTLDIATEFLFGTSTYTLLAEKRRPEDDKFVKAFTYVQNTVEGKSGILALFMPDRRFKRDCRYIHSTWSLSLLLSLCHVLYWSHPMHWRSIRFGWQSGYVSRNKVLRPMVDCRLGGRAHRAIASFYLGKGESSDWTLCSSS